MMRKAMVSTKETDMPLSISEYAGAAYVSGRNLSADVPQEPPIQIQQMASGSSAAATMSTFAAGTRLVSLASDVAFYLIFGSSTASTGTQSSTNAWRLPAGVNVLRGVTPSSRLIAFST